MVAETGLTRQTVVAILRRIEKAVFNQFQNNPEEFIIRASTIINEQKATVIIQHITYNKLDSAYGTNIFTEPTLKGKLGANVIKAQKHLYDHVIYDSENEKTFAGKIVERFYNPFIKHYLKDISLNSLSKWETRDFPTVKDNFTKLGKKAPLTVFSFAAMLVLYSGKSDANFTANDTPAFVEFIRSSFNENDIKGWVSAVINNQQIWTENLAAIPYFIDKVTKDVETILTKGIKVALEEMI
jgi:mannitol-1-phosphate/altronate dehydrogenase